MLSNAIALAALILSAFAMWRTFRFNARQEAFIEGQEKLNSLLLERNQGEALADKKADFGATFVKLGTNSGYRLKIWNKGRASARNVRIEFPDGNTVLLDDEITEKFPLEVLERQQSVDLIAVVSMATKRKHAFLLTWADDAAEHNEKLVYATV